MCEQLAVHPADDSRHRVLRESPGWGVGVMTARHLGIPRLRRGQAARPGRLGTARRDLIRRVLAAGSVAALAAALAVTGATAAAAGTAGSAKPGKLAKLVLSPAAATIAPGAAQAYTAQGFDASGNSLGDLTSQATFTISGGGSCTANVCTTTTLGSHTVTGTIKKVTGTATLTAAAADLAATQTVSTASPYYYAPVTFTTTVTNTSTTTTSTGVTAAVNEPAGLVSPAATTGTGSYAGGTWTIGSLAPGATATLTITGDAGDVSDGTQTVTATVSAATYDPNPANNTASASEASQPAPINAILAWAPGSGNFVDICANPPVTETFDVSTVNAINPAAPPPAPDSLVYSWTCNDTAAAALGCGSPVNGGSETSPFISFASNTFAAGDDILLTVAVFETGTDPNYSPAGSLGGESASHLTFGTTCIGP